MESLGTQSEGPGMEPSRAGAQGLESELVLALAFLGLGLYLHPDLNTFHFFTSAFDSPALALTQAP